MDDKKASAEILSLIVKNLGNEVRTASDGDQAIEAAAEFLPEMGLAWPSACRGTCFALHTD